MAVEQRARNIAVEVVTVLVKTIVMGLAKDVKAIVVAIVWEIATTLVKGAAKILVVAVALIPVQEAQKSRFR